jgi:hypothetical protein
MNDKTFFTVTIESAESEQSFIQVFWTWASHLGEAIDKILRACANMGIESALPSEADTYDFATLPKHAIFNEKLDVHFDQTRYCFPTEKSFLPPKGIIKSCLDGDFEYELIHEGFDRTKRDDGIYEVELVVERDKLYPIFNELIRQLPSIRVFWVKLAADWEDKDKEEVWVNEDLNTPGSITDYLMTHSKDTVENGHVTLTVYSEVGKTNLSIDSHKTIKILTKSVRMQSKMVRALMKLRFEEASELHSLEYGYYHWHYRPAKSKARARLIAALKRDGFSAWNPNEAA